MRFKVTWRHVDNKAPAGSTPYLLELRGEDIDMPIRKKGCLRVKFKK